MNLEVNKMVCEDVSEYETETDNIFISYIGDTFERTRTILDSSGNAVNITGYTIYFTVKKDYSDSDADAIIKKTITSFDSPTDGEYAISVSSAETIILLSGVYYVDIKSKDTSDKITTLFNGKFILKQAVTLTTS